MKKYKILLLTVILLGISSCTKEELLVVDQPIPVNEDSPSYQGYLAERAISFIKIYRFDQVKSILDRITEKSIKDGIMVTYNEYKTRADNEALYYVNPTNDTLYFVVPSETEPDRLTRTWMYLNNEKANIPKTKGVLSGLKKFSKLQTFIADYTLVDEIHELSYLQDLERFDWSRNEEFHKQYFPNESYTPVKLVVDFSKNHRLKAINLVDVDIEKMVFPETEIEELKLEGVNSRYNTNDVLNTLKAKSVSIEGQSSRNKFEFKGQGIKTLKLSSRYTSFGFTTLDVSESTLESLVLSHGGAFVTDMKLNKGLKLFSSGADALTKKPELPVSLEKLGLTNYDLTSTADLNFSELVNLKGFTLYQRSTTHKANVSLLKFPLNLEILEYVGHGSIDRLDLSYLLKLRSINLTGTNDVVFPPNVEQVYMQYISGVLDLSGLQSLKRIIIYTAPSDGVLNEIIFPPNLTEDQINDIDNSFYTRIAVTKACKLTNMPEWMNKYITYND